MALTLNWQKEFGSRHRMGSEGLKTAGEPPYMSVLLVCWAVFALGTSAFVAQFFFAAGHPIIDVALTVAGGATCGMAWLFSRALFRSCGSLDMWPFVTVGCLFLIGAVLTVWPGPETGVRGYLREIQAVLGSAMLILTFVETCDGRALPWRERRFRFIFGLSYLLIVGVALILRLPEFAPVRDAGQVCLAFMCLLGSMVAVFYRLRSAWPQALSPHIQKANPVVDAVLVARLKNALEQDKAYLNPVLKVSVLAAMLREPEYKVSRAITCGLGYANFNQMINAYRVDAAQAMLTDPAMENIRILTIALDCGFNSVGPFNRAFKRRFGQTPGEYRAAAKRG